MCRPGTFQLVAAGLCYGEISGNQNRATAASSCAAFGTGYHLAEVTSSAINTALITKWPSQTHWIGATRNGFVDGQFAMGDWRWETSNKVFFTGTRKAEGANAASTFVNWKSDQPTGGQPESCARMDPDGTWGDNDCATSYYAFCEGPLG
jgi:hypothetical protein